MTYRSAHDARAHAPGRPGPAREPRPLGGPALALLVSAVFITQFDYFVVNVAAPTLGRDLHAGPGSLELVVGGYAFAYAAGLITGGRLGDRFGYRRVLIVGMAGFGVTSLLCGLAASPGQLVAARLVQGMTGALMVPQVLALITATIPPPVRPRAMGWYGAAAGLGSLGGQVFGGVLLQLDIAGLGWRVIFFVNVPVCAVAALLGQLLLPEPEPARSQGLDPAGACGVAVTLGLVLLPLALGPNAGWAPWTWGSLAAAIPSGAATWWWQRRLRARGGSPVLALSLFQAQSFRVGLVANGAFVAYFASFMFVLTLLLQRGFQLDALRAGLAFAPMGVCFGITSLLARAWVTKHGYGIVIAGGLMTAAAVTALGVGLLAEGGHLALAWVMAALALAGSGNGVTFPSLIGASLGNVPAQQAGAASGMLVTGQQFAGAAGVAAVGTAFFSAAGTRPAAAGYAHAAAWTIPAQLLLILMVIKAVGYLARASR